MQKNLYFRQVLRRQNVLLNTLLGLFLKFASYPRLMLEVFIRKDFGDRYFSLASVITIIAYFLFVPYLFWLMHSSYRGEPELWDVVKAIPSVFVFLGIFLAVSIWHYLQIRRNPSVFDFKQFSLFSGTINPLFFRIQLFGKTPSVRLIETVYEPLLFFIVGYLLLKFDLMVGYLIVWCSIFYSLSYVAAYRQGDNFVKDKIDEMICNEDMEEAFVEDQPYSRRGFQFRGDKPNDRQQRSTLADEFIDYEEVAAEAM